ncbi:MAG TPA: hypothetical protein DC054_26755 [Blastocatellia bacterium]|nr:hypothetical protein [Blastocatellia bacterium]
MNARKALLTILVAGLIAGTFDITYACIFNNVRFHATPAAVLRSVASGALGPSARDGGIKIAILGLFFHFLIALIWAGIYFLASRVLPFMITHPIISGILYGLCVYLVMYGIVLRVSAIHVTRYPWSYPWPVLIGNVLIHTLGIGLTIALVTRKFSR